MSTPDAALMEASLVTIADAGLEIQDAVFERFFAAYPDRRPIFYNLEHSSRRMTDETVQMMFGLTTDEKWVWPLVAELLFTHRNYGVLPIDEYDAFIDMTVDALGTAAGEAWNAATDAAWRHQADRLKQLVGEAKSGWEEAMPGSLTGTYTA